MTPSESPHARMVIRALYSMDFHRRDSAVSANDVASYLEISEEDVLVALRELKRERIVRDRRRKGRRVWVPWEGSS